MPEAAQRELTFLAAITAALKEEMARDAAVMVLGEDVAVGGPFGATRGLAEEFGTARVVNTPISEGAVMGVAVGAAVLGRRPVVEIMFIDFITLAMDQLVNQAAKLHYMSGGQLRVPLVVRTQCGATGSYAAQHSQCLEAWFLHVPGVKVVMPATPADARGLLKAAIRDDNPVLFIEQRGLYWSKGAVEEGEAGIVPLGRAAIRRGGEDVTVVALASMVSEALSAAGQLAEEGISAEVIDPRSLHPLDLETIAESVKKTHRLLIVHEAVAQGGVGAEVAMQAQLAAFNYLDAPVRRLGAPFTPVPYSPVLERGYVPNAAAIVATVQQLMRE
ncbi:MAG: alpha-ketoacid dehydrogenase subunit beta [Candidatus Tectomicrobia bacterium]|nr:alpha-ketoacid dehydrogenase subunit beta [Candidatus Tectomicrobia bacterium]